MSSQPPKHPLNKAAPPIHSKTFDPWNSSSTGHQRPDNQPGTGWRESRNKKLNSQFQAGSTGGARLSDTWGAGSDDWDEREKVLVPKSIKERKGKTVMDLLVKAADPQKSRANDGQHIIDPLHSRLTKEDALTLQRKEQDDEADARKGARGIFDGVVVYVNGSTFPLVSDHKLKQLVTENGGNMSLHLGRRRVTHVILGRPIGAGQGAGGGLAGGKLEKEIKKGGGCAVHYVSPEWIMESLKAGKRLPEARFRGMNVASKRQDSVYSLYSKNSMAADDGSKLVKS
ncbi:hypothetical protein S40285_01267 [Stachybotrys chlorohalonatus IBT 40285]|uniref:BRCT domain-containing protein n=1 Tax=Stachybotrys chlorohalonatus (strain IBT 40285) TaxID=1283841 RepID=A0A084QR05_STAC4|nr:hypothetical protein S40285_01267 [Stachybotrys chlorohalonata IBT 40285]